MNLSPGAIRESYAFCRRVNRRAGSNFLASFRLLPHAKRPAMNALYAFMRHTDDLADNPQPAPLRAKALVQWRAALEDALLGRFDPSGPHDAAGQALLPALADAVTRYQVPPEHLHAVIDGVQMDLKRRRYEVFDQLEQYCCRVASAVGLACIHVWGFRGRGSAHGQEALRRARSCGIALQLTNVLRDIKEDARQDRVYLPLEDLRRCGYSVDELKAGVVNGRFLRLMELEIERAEHFYREGAELLDRLEPDGRRIFGMMMATYRALLRTIQRRPADVFTRRIRIGRAKKLQLAFRWTLLPPRVAALL